jgi:hypothetical protein
MPHVRYTVHAKSEQIPYIFVEPSKKPSKNKRLAFYTAAGKAGHIKILAGFKVSGGTNPAAGVW